MRWNSRPKPSPSPAPTPEVEVSPARSIAVTATAQVTPEEAVPKPEASAALAEAVTLPQPEALAEVTPPETLPTPEASVEVAPAAPVPQPQVEAAVTEARDVQPQASVSVTQTQPVPSPEASVEVTEARDVQPQASAEVTPAQAVPQPEVSAATTEAQPVPQPQVEANVTEARDVQPQVSAEVTESQAVPQPEVSAATTEAEPVPQPQVSAEVAEARDVQPQARASVTEAQPVPSPRASSTVSAAREVQPQATASVAAARTVPQPSASASAAPASTVPQPAATSTTAASRGVAITPQAQVSAAQPVPTPQASVGRVASRAETGTAGFQTNSTPGGNAERSGQTAAVPDATAEGRGTATSPDGSATPSGAPLVRIPYEENRLRPLAVIIDNVNGYPQAGLAEASLIAEMPVEGGLTRLMTVYDQADPQTVGPVRSARDYFLELALGLGGVLVHDGGSPTALAAIANSDFPTLNANAAGGSELFQRAGERRAPYNLYSTGDSLRQAVNTLNLGAARVVSGTTYLPAEDTESVVSAEVAYSGDYSSAFRFINDLNQYRWVRAGEDAVDASGAGVYVDAVIVAEVEARPIPDDLEGRLYMRLRGGGPATLYLRGKAIPGRWEPEGGVSFFTSLGDPVDLTPLKTWVLFAPGNAQVVEQ